MNFGTDFYAPKAGLAYASRGEADRQARPYLRDFLFLDCVVSPPSASQRRRVGPST